MADIKKLTKDLKQKPYGGAWAIDDPKVILATQNFLDENAYYDIINNTNVNEYLDNYFQFVKSSHNKLDGLTKFKSLAFSLGTTNTFDVFTASHPTRRLVSFKGEYIYHSIMQRTIYGRTNSLSHPDQLQSNDCLIISCPFADTGAEHPHMNEILARCDQLKVPVLLDLAYINIAQDITVDLKHDCIEALTTSLSKVFPLGHVRVGMRMKKQNIDDGLDMTTASDWVNKLGIGIANSLIKEFDANYIFNKYKQKQTAMCNQLDVTPSKCVIFGIDHKDKYTEYNRGFETNRLCFSKHFEIGVS
tara:strand:- start:352 stop:1260 length:909 start_codon:yes stop_codon:yes gene_type:complete